jgi:predicted nucleotidyltransferase
MSSDWVKYQVKEAIRSIDPDAKVILFGSRARGDNDSASDWDFLVLTTNPINENKKREIRHKLIDTELQAEEVISTIIHSEESWMQYVNTPLYKNISSDGIEL